MIISKELLEAKLAQEVAARDDCCARMNAHIGAINLLHHLLAAAELPEPAAAPTKPAPSPASAAAKPAPSPG